MQAEGIRKIDAVHLREILHGEITGLTAVVTHAKIPLLCADLGIPVPPDDMSKRDRLEWAISQVSDADLADVAERFLVTRSPTPAVRISLEDMLWAGDGCPEISKRCRRDIARALAPEDLYTCAKGFDKMLDTLWDLGTDPWSEIFGGAPIGLRAEVQRHVHQHPGDWSVETLFDKLGTLDAQDRRFAYFLEGLASANVRPDEPAQRHFVDVVNGVLHGYGMELRETRYEDGYPVFSLVSTRLGPRSRPKNLIFASSTKPDLRLRDAISNDIEIMSDPGAVLVYDRPIGAGGLTWAELQNWWAETEGIAEPGEAKKSLFKRLKSCLPATSPPQSMLFMAYFETFGKAVPQLPALLPEVWLHWDPQTVKQRGADALFRFRMDFLLLMPHGVRVVIEVDGKQHYADSSGRADPGLYATTMAADRDLKLAGYEVFRFGAAELSGPDAGPMAKAFFTDLIKRYGG
ncbi:hypothetical protein GJ700_03025 [Duganella sp. FT92W]|uniref:AbiJ-NTD3 domain-containing protein n=1 Tax=Pseudoduganella rivuli TaxID=2666085 RepID=A0A7X2IIV8_9BURK|nr:hypothetical protein [Pseudoduganella rivuli]MRV70689.1 hypothetical protein [Pseudoduganella rivuli]